MRPGERYAGGDPDEIIVVGGKRYGKKPVLRALQKDGYGKVIMDRPYTEREYYSHSTEEVGPGPGWDFRMGYMADFEAGGYKFGKRLDPAQLSNLPLYRLVPMESEK